MSCGQRFGLEMKISRLQEIMSGTIQLLSGGGGVLPSKRLMEMCRWIGSHFHDWIDHNEVESGYNGVTFSTRLKQLE